MMRGFLWGLGLGVGVLVAVGGTSELIRWVVKPEPVEAQAGVWRFAVSGYGGTLSSSQGFNTLSDCQYAQAELNQGWPMSACRPSLAGQ